MSEIINKSRIKSPFIASVRELLEHRALWLYFIYNESAWKKNDITQIIENGINKCGIYQGKNLVKKGKVNNLKGLKKSLFGYFARKVFEIKINKSTENELNLSFHYCPLVKAWQKQNCTDEEIGKLCNYAMCGDKGIAKAYGAELEIGNTIAHGNKSCEIRFVKQK